MDAHGFASNVTGELITEVPAGAPTLDVHHPDDPPRSDVLVELTSTAGHWLVARVRKGSASTPRALTAVSPTPNPDTWLVVAAGDAFRVVLREVPVSIPVTTNGPVIQLMPDPTHDILLLVTPWTVTALGDERSVWTTERLSIDGLRLDEIDGDHVAGVADPDDTEPHDVAIDLLDGSHAGGAGLVP